MHCMLSEMYPERATMKQEGHILIDCTFQNEAFKTGHKHYDDNLPNLTIIPS